jgi:hypothetical protein
MHDNQARGAGDGQPAGLAIDAGAANVAAGFDLRCKRPVSADGRGTFNQAASELNSPLAHHITDYHKPSDTADKIDYEDLDRIGDVARSGACGRRRAPQFTKVEQSTQAARAPACGCSPATVPDYATEVKGLLRAAWSAGGPARARAAEGA